MSSNTTIVIPCFNEAARIEIEKYVSFLAENENFLFIFVDDGSTDQTLKNLQQLKNLLPEKIEVMSLAKNVGKAEAVRHGVLASLRTQTPHVGYWDADLATPLQEIPRFLNELQSHNTKKMICGSRVKMLGADIQRRILRHYLGRIVATLISIVLRLPVYDTQCGAKLFNREMAELIFKDPFISPWLFDVELIARIVGIVGREHAMETIHELPLKAWHDIGRSKVRLSYIPKIPLELLRISRRYHTALKKR